MKNILIVLGFFTIVIATVSCKKDDSYTPLEISAEADFVEVIQNGSIEVDVLQNDTNIPATGILIASASENGVVTIIDVNDTPSDPSDDLVRYEPSTNFSGNDTFEYTVCDNEGIACASATVSVTVVTATPVVLDLSAVPYEKLSDYNFFAGTLADQEPNYGVVPYKPISTLFTDYALKKRFIWLPNNTKGSYNGDHDILDLPVGTVLIKAFYYNNVLPQNNRRNIETRLMIKKESGWIFANYIWNEAQTEAYFDLSGDFTDVTWMQDGETRTVNYRIPPESQCFTCHKSEVNSIPIGVKPQNLNAGYPYMEGTKNQLQKLVEMGYLEDNIPAEITTVVDWRDESKPLNIRMRSYVDINCAHCHSDDRHCDYRPMRFQFSMTDDPANLGVCVEPDTFIPPYTKIVDPGNIENSLLYFRLNTTEEQYRMPLLGRSLIHEENIRLVEDWINSLDPTCD